MKKKLYVGTAILLIIIILILSSDNKRALSFTDVEKSYINEHRDAQFSIGYNNAFPNYLLVKRFCEKVQVDTGLNIKIAENTWSDNLKKLESGELSMLANMNRTQATEIFSFFSMPLESQNVGVYSRYDAMIERYEALQGKKIGIEEGLIFLELFSDNFPDIKIQKMIYKDHEALQKALSSKEIDGYISTEKYDTKYENLCYFNIPVLSKENNYVGISKKHPILFSIINKEIEKIKHEAWDLTLVDVIAFELEKTLVNLKDEVKPIEEQDLITVGLPNEYALYTQSDGYNTQGVLESILKRMELLSGDRYLYVFDSLEQIKERNDIDLYLSSEEIEAHMSNPLFFEQIIAVGQADKKEIREIYDLMSYKLGAVEVGDIMRDLKLIMPNLDLKSYKSFDSIAIALKEGEIDYALIPSRYQPVLEPKNALYYKGNIKNQVHHFIVKDKAYISVVNKCLEIINANESISDLITASVKPTYFERYKVALYGIGIALILLIVTFGKIIKPYYTHKYTDKLLDIKNMKWLEKHMPQRECVFYLVKLKNMDVVKHFYGPKVCIRALKYFVKGVKDTLSEDEAIICVRENIFIVVKNRSTDCELYGRGLNHFFGKQFNIYEDQYEYQLAVAGIDYTLQEDFNKVLISLEIGLKISEGKEQFVWVTEEIIKRYKNGLTQDIIFNNKVTAGRIDIEYCLVEDDQKNHLGYYIRTACEIHEGKVLKHDTVYKLAEKFDKIETLDKLILKKVFKKPFEEKTKVFLYLSEATLAQKGFENWLKMKLTENINVDLVVFLNLTTYENKLEVVEKCKGDRVTFAIQAFGMDIKTDIMTKYYDVELLKVFEDPSKSFLQDEEIVEFIEYFMKKYHKKIMIYDGTLKTYFVKETLIYDRTGG